MGKTQGVMTPASPARKAMSRKLRGGVHLYGHLALVEGALGPVAGLVLEVSGHCEGLLRGGDDDLAELRSALEVLDVDAEALVEFDVGLLNVLQPSGEGEGGAFVGGE